MRTLPGLLLLVLVAALAGRAQTAGSAAEVRRVFVIFPQGKPALAPVERELRKELARSGITLAASREQCEAVLIATGDVYIRGYISLNPRAGSSPLHGEPVRSGFLSVELKGRGNETLWSYLATPRTSPQIERALSKQVTKELLIAIRGAKP